MNFPSENVRSVVVTALIVGVLGIAGFVSTMTSPAGPINPPEVPGTVTAKPASTSQDQPATVPSNAEPKAKVKVQDSSVANSAPQLAPQTVPVDQTRKLIPVPQIDVPADNIQVDVTPAFGLRLTSDGLLPGRLNLVDPVSGSRMPATKLTINFVKNGTIVSQVKPGVAGIFQAKDLVPGVYSMIASGPDGFFATGILVLPPFKKLVEIADEDFLQVDADVVDLASVPIVRMMIRERLFPSTANSTSPANEPIRDENRLGRPLRTPTLKLGADGKLMARLNWIAPETEKRIPVTDTVAYLIRDGVITARSEVDATGVCSFPSVGPGSYALLVVPLPTVSVPTPDATPPRRGYGAVGINVAAAANNAKTVDARLTDSVYRRVGHVRLLDDGINLLPDIDVVPLEDIENSVLGTSDGMGAAGIAGAPPARSAPGAAGGGGGGSDVTPLLVGGGIGALLAAGSNRGSSNVSATATANGGGGGGGGDGGGGGGGSPKAIK